MGNPDKAELVSSFLLELRRGMLILCVLAKLRERKYGYSLIAELEGTGVRIEANTLYPLLRRLEGQGLLESAWDTGGAKPRKYYKTTDFGEEVLTLLVAHWQDAVRGVNEILEETNHET